MGKLIIYDPREHDRCLMIKGGKSNYEWHSKEQGVVFFESKGYALSIDAEGILTLITGLIAYGQCQKMAFRLSGFNHDCLPVVPKSFETLLLEGILLGKMKSNQTEELIDFYDRHLDYGVLTIYGLLGDREDIISLGDFPSVLKNAKTLSFVCEIDLDGILMGFVWAREQLDELIAALVEV